MAFERGAKTSALVHRIGEWLIMNKHTSNQLLDEIARESLGQDFNLSSDLMVKIRKENTKNMKKRTLITAFAAVVVVTAILASVPSVAQAIKRMLGYIPGVGVVEQSIPLRIQKAAVATEFGETIVKVPQIVADSEHVRLVYQIENIPFEETAGAQLQDYCRMMPWLLLPDGRKLDANTVAMNSWGGGYSRQLEFAHIDAEVNDFKLVIPCFEGTLKPAEDLGIEIPLSLVPAPAGMTVYPIVELPTPTAIAPVPATASAAEQLSLVVSRYIQSEDQLILLGSLGSTSTDFRLSLVDTLDVHVQDSAGSDVALSEDYTLLDQAGQRSAQNLPFAYQIFDPYQAGTATLTIDRAWITRTADKTFEFDPGSNSQPGQTWQMNLPITVDDHTVTITDIIRSEKGPGLNIYYTSSEGITNVSIMDLEHAMTGGGGGSDSTGFGYQGVFPSGALHLTISSYDELVEGPWTTQVDLPASKTAATSASTEEACLTETSWQKALLSSTRNLPAGSAENTLVLSNVLAPDYQYHILKGSLDGSQPIDLGLGSSASLSPDGKTLVYSSDDGLKLLNGWDGVPQSIAGTTRSDLGPIWSPDGKTIAFTRGPASGLIGAPGPYKLMLMDADGSNIRELLADNGANFAQVWTVDGKSVIYTNTNENGAIVQSIDVQTGAITFLTQVNYQSAGVAFSPDGKRIAHEAMLPGNHYAVYVSDLDGGNAKLIADAYPIVVTIPQWSPDGKWLAVSVQDMSISETSPVVAFVNVETCQITPMIDLHGYVTSWR